MAAIKTKMGDVRKKMAAHLSPKLELLLWWLCLLEPIESPPDCEETLDSLANQPINHLYKQILNSIELAPRAFWVTLLPNIYKNDMKVCSIIWLYQSIKLLIKLIKLSN